ncbi:hypothetical protein ACOME3_001578 [Neoechinorhynchus agilis]
MSCVTGERIDSVMSQLPRRELSNIELVTDEYLSDQLSEYKNRNFIELNTQVRSYIRENRYHIDNTVNRLKKPSTADSMKTSIVDKSSFAPQEYQFGKPVAPEMVKADVVGRTGRSLESSFVIDVNVIECFQKKQPNGNDEELISFIDNLHRKIGDRKHDNRGGVPDIVSFILSNVLKKIERKLREGIGSLDDAF